MDLPVFNVQTSAPPTTLDPSSHRSSSYYSERTSVPFSANHLGVPAAYTQHCAPAADAAFERHAGQAMHILALPPPTSLPSTPFGQRREPLASRAKLHPQFSPARSGQHSYPSPPMSDSHSPARRSAQLVESESHRYPHPGSEVRRLEALPPPPPPPPFDHRSAPPQGIPLQRALYLGEGPPRGQPLQYPSGRTMDPPSYGGVSVAQNYAYGYPVPSVPSFLGGHGPGPQALPTGMLTPQAIRPNKPARRTKAHVASACVNCKKAHLSCDVQRPCGRCVASGKQDSCKDVQHKKRGRPRLRDDKEFSLREEARQPPTHIMSTRTEPLSSFSSSHRATDPLRVLTRPSRESEEVTPNIQPQTYVGPASGHPSSAGSHRAVVSPYATGPDFTNASLPVAFLNLDLVISKTNAAFQVLVGCVGDIRGKSLGDFVDSRQIDILHRMRNELRDERDDRDPSYMAPITPIGQDPVQSVAERDVDQVSHGYTDRPFLLNFRLPNGQYQPMQTQVRLAKTSLYFVTLVVHTRSAAPPLLTQQLSSPTPRSSLHTHPAPTPPAPRDSGPYSARPPSSASSAPTSPYFNFQSVRTSLPTINSSSYCPSYNFSPTSAAEQGYFSTIQTPGYPSPYPPVSRNGSVLSQSVGGPEPSRESSRSGRLQGLQLPPIRTGPVPSLPSPRSQEFTEYVMDRVRPRDSPASADHPDSPDTGKRRRLNIHEVLQ